MRRYRAHETARMQQLDGMRLADFGQRAAAFTVDLILAAAALAVGLFAWGAIRWYRETGGDVNQPRTYHLSMENELVRIAIGTVLPVLYFGFFTYYWNGRTPGKRLFRIRVVSLAHERMSLWHSIERALGYGAATLEAGFGFLQFFIHPCRRTVEDRIAETIVVKEKDYQERFGASAEAANPGETAHARRP